MNIRVLGADGGDMQDFSCIGLLVEDSILLDAGTVCSKCTFEELLQINHVFISHTHIDHIKDLGLLVDVVTGFRKTPLTVYGTHDTLHALKSNYFNQILWPDFTSIPSPQSPVLQFKEIRPLQDVWVDGIRVRAIPVNHTIETMGFLVEKDNDSFAYSADTGPTDLFWQEVNQQPNLRAVLLEVAFPSRLQWLADLSKHLTPQTAELESQKLKHLTLPIYLFHLKPAYFDELQKELAPLLQKNFSLLRKHQNILL